MPRLRVVWRRFTSSAIVVVALAVGIALIQSGASVFGVSVPPLSGHDFHSYGSWAPTLSGSFRSLASTNAPECSNINSNASLNGTYVGMYNGLPNLTKNWVPEPNQTAPVNQSAYPNVTVGEQQLIHAWLVICSSSQYVALYEAGGHDGITSGLQLDRSTGYYEATFGFQLVVQCNASVTDPTAVCETATTWQVNLASGSIAGPYSRAWVASPSGAPSAPNPRNSTTSPSLFLGFHGMGGYVALTGGVAAIVIAATLLRARRRHRGVGPGTGLPEGRFTGPTQEEGGIGSPSPAPEAPTEEDLQAAQLAEGARGQSGADGVALPKSMGKGVVDALHDVF